MKLGILGAGQLARMLTLAAYPLGISTSCIDPNPESCAREVTSVITASFEDEHAIQQWLKSVDVVTYETENIPLTTAKYISNTHHLNPSMQTLEIAQDRLHEKTFFNSLQIPTTKFFAISSEDDLNNATAEIGFPCVLKTRRMGYDGKGQFVLKSRDDVPIAWQTLGSQSLILEQFIHFEFETSIIAVRNQKNEMVFYPLIRNHHVQGILRTSEAPLIHSQLQQAAQHYARQILQALNYVGVLTIEFFYDGKKLIANEMAPRVHNSGHWTIEGAQTSQFENHLRALFHLPLGSTATTGYSFMRNCIGSMLSLESCLAVPGVHYHQYGKTPRKDRKVGHVTLVESNLEKYQESQKTLLEIASLKQF